MSTSATMRTATSSPVRRFLPPRTAARPGRPRRASTRRPSAARNRSCTASASRARTADGSSGA
jgi:hypothetical protein